MSKIDGGSLEWHGQEFFLLATNATVKGMKKAAIYTQGVARKIIGGVGTGRTYKRGSKIHRASAPGQPPARDTGILTSSVSYDVTVKGAVVTGRIGPDVDKIKGRAKTSDPEYGLYQELGSLDETRKPRPWLVPSVIKATPRIIRILRKAIGGLI